MNQGKIFAYFTHVFIAALGASASALAADIDLSLGSDEFLNSPKYENEGSAIYSGASTPSPSTPVVGQNLLTLQKQVANKNPAIERIIQNTFDSSISSRQLAIESEILQGIAQLAEGTVQKFNHELNVEFGGDWPKFKHDRLDSEMFHYKMEGIGRTTVSVVDGTPAIRIIHDKSARAFRFVLRSALNSKHFKQYTARILVAANRTDGKVGRAVTDFIIDDLNSIDISEIMRRQDVHNTEKVTSPLLADFWRTRWNGTFQEIKFKDFEFSLIFKTSTQVLLLGALSYMVASIDPSSAPQMYAKIVKFIGFELGYAFVRNIFLKTVTNWQNRGPKNYRVAKRTAESTGYRFYQKIGSGIVYGDPISFVTFPVDLLRSIYGNFLKTESYTRYDFESSIGLYRNKKGIGIDLPLPGVGFSLLSKSNATGDAETFPILGGTVIPTSIHFNKRVPLFGRYERSGINEQWAYLLSFAILRLDQIEWANSTIEASLMGLMIASPWLKKIYDQFVWAIKAEKKYAEQLSVNPSARRMLDHIHRERLRTKSFFTNAKYFSFSMHMTLTSFAKAATLHGFFSKRFQKQALENASGVESNPSKNTWSMKAFLEKKLSDLYYFLESNEYASRMKAHALFPDLVSEPAKTIQLLEPTSNNVPENFNTPQVIDAIVKNLRAEAPEFAQMSDEQILTKAWPSIEDRFSLAGCPAIFNPK